jgi:hypothetical protein
MAAVFFVHPEDHADRPLWLEPALPNHVHRRERRHNAGAVVLRALAHVPAIDVSAEDDHLLGVFAADDLTHDIRLHDWRFHVRLHGEVDLDRLAFALQARQHQRVFGGDGGGGYFRLLLVVDEGAGVRQLHGQRGN